MGGTSEACSGRKRCLPRLCDFLMHFRKNGTRMEHGCTSHSDPRDQSSNCQHSGQGGEVHASPMLTSMVANSASASDCSVTPEGGSHSHQKISLPSDVAIDSSSSLQALNEKLSLSISHPEELSMLGNGRLVGIYPAKALSL